MERGNTGDVLIASPSRMPGREEWAHSCLRFVLASFPGIESSFQVGRVAGVQTAGHYHPGEPADRCACFLRAPNFMRTDACSQFCFNGSRETRKRNRDPPRMNSKLQAITHTRLLAPDWRNTMERTSSHPASAKKTMGLTHRKRELSLMPELAASKRQEGASSLPIEALAFWAALSQVRFRLAC